MNFIKDSLRELKHVVWPTTAETQKYFIIVLVVLIAFGIYLFFASTVFSESLIWLKDQV
jgi:preprotein translocase SecE subunit